MGVEEAPHNNEVQLPTAWQGNAAPADLSVRPTRTP